jgi:adenylate cyclase
VARLISADELAELVPSPREYVEKLVELGILERTDEGLHDSSDAHVVRLMLAFEDAGMALEDVARGIAAGELAFPLGLFLPEPEASATTYAELAAKLGRSPELVRRLAGELGLPPPANDAVRTEDAEILSLILTTLDLADDEDLSRFARLYGGSVQRLVTAGLQFFDRTVYQRAVTLGMSNEEQDQFVYQRAAAYTQLVARVVPLLQQRHREYGVREYLTGLTEGWMEERAIGTAPRRRPPAIAFLDLTGYTRLAEERGDEYAAEVAADLASVVQDTSRVHGGRPVKWLGDGVMFHFNDSTGAIRGGIDLVEQTERAIAVPARIGINAGTVIVQEGDYFGRTVNVAARIADYAGSREVVVSEEALESADVAEVEFELVGDVPLKGIANPVRLHRAVRR